jgi:2'-5' RNA ligase
MLYFIAIVAPNHINDQVLVWKKYMEKEYGCKVALRSPAHITLVPPFSMSQETEKELSIHLREFSKSQKSFQIRLKDFDNFKPRVIFLHVEPSPLLLALKSRLDNYLVPLKKFPIKKEERPFHPHITIANRDLNKKEFPKAWAYFQELQYQAAFTANEISLLRHNNSNWEIGAAFSMLEF